MIDEKLLAEIVKTNTDAQFGYTRVDCQIYHRHVSALLEEVEALRAENLRLKNLAPAEVADSAKHSVLPEV